MCDFFRTVILLVVTLHFNTEDIFNFYPLFLISDLVFRKCIYNIIGLLYFLHIFDYCWGTFYMGLHAGHLVSFDYCLGAFYMGVQDILDLFDYCWGAFYMSVQDILDLFYYCWGAFYWAYRTLFEIWIKSLQILKLIFHIDKIYTGR